MLYIPPDRFLQMTTTFGHSQHLVIMNKILRSNVVIWDQMFWFEIKCSDLRSNVVIYNISSSLQQFITITTIDHHHNNWSSWRRNCEATYGHVQEKTEKYFHFQKTESLIIVVWCFRVSMKKKSQQTSPFKSWTKLNV